MRSSILPIRYSDFDPSFIPNPYSGDITILKNEDSIKRAMINLIMTEFSERLFYPEIGCGIYRVLFEQMSFMAEVTIQDHIETVLKNWEPRVLLQEVVVNANYDEERYDITVYYNITNSPDLMKIDFFLELIR